MWTTLLIWATKLPFVSSTITLFKDKKRLLIEYIMIAIVVALCGFSLTMWWQKKNQEETIEAMGKKVTILESVTTKQSATIDSLKSQREIDSTSLQSLQQDYKNLWQSDQQSKKRLGDLEKQNAKVKKYLDEPIPRELVCLLTDTCKGTDNSGESGKTKSP